MCKYLLVLFTIDLRKDNCYWRTDILKLKLNITYTFVLNFTLYNPIIQVQNTELQEFLYVLKWSSQIVYSKSSLGFIRWFKFTLNHLIGSCMANYDWPFGTLPFGLFGQIWTQWTLRHILETILVIFDICHFLTISGPFEYF